MPKNTKALASPSILKYPEETFPIPPAIEKFTIALIPKAIIHTTANPLAQL